MSRFQRVQQWNAFSKSWHIYDAKWQNPFHSARKLTPVLEGKSKPIYSPHVECGDHVVIINSRHISLLGREWKFRVYFHHPGYNKVFYMLTIMILVTCLSSRTNTNSTGDCFLL